MVVVGLTSLEAEPGGAFVKGPNWGGRVRGADVAGCPRGRRAFWRWFWGVATGSASAARGRK